MTIDTINQTISEFLSNREEDSSTYKTYKYVLDMFREQLQEKKMDLLPPSESTDDEMRVYMQNIGTAANAFVSFSKRKDKTSSSTQKLRYSVLKMFYDSQNNVVNPIYSGTRKQARKRSHVIDSHEIVEALSKIDTKTLAGMRDYALICTTFDTSANLTQLSCMLTNDLVFDERGVVIALHGKRQTRVALNKFTQETLRASLHAFYGEKWHEENLPLWPSFSPSKRLKGGGLTSQGVGSVIKKRTGSTVSFAVRREYIKAIETMNS